MPGLAVLLVAFWVGSIPFTNLVAHHTRGVDLRDVGTGTVSGTGLYRVAGFGPLAIAGILDVAKGAAGPLLASQRPGLAAAAAGAAVTGHNWSPFLRGAGGRGISPAMGALAVIAWQGALVLAGGMAVGKLAGETALGSLASFAALVPVLAVTAGGEGVLAGAAVLLPLLGKRLAGNSRAPRDRRSVYLNRLLYDRDERDGETIRRRGKPG